MQHVQTGASPGQDTDSTPGVQAWAPDLRGSGRGAPPDAQDSIRKTHRTPLNSDLRNGHQNGFLEMMEPILLYK